MDMSSVSKQERQSLKAVSSSESTMFAFDKPEPEDVQSSVLFELPATALSSGLAGPLVGLEDSCPCCLKLVLVSSVKSGIWSSACVELCLLPISTFGEVM